MPPAKFYIVGLGPGDPELMTVKAARIIAAAPVVAFFAKRGRIGRARGIIDGQLMEGVEELRFEYPFTTEVAVEHPRYLADMGAFYEDCATRLQARLEAGRNVALLFGQGDGFRQCAHKHHARLFAQLHHVGIIAAEFGNGADAHAALVAQ